MSLVLQLDTSDPALREVSGRRVEVAHRLTIGRGGADDLFGFAPAGPAAGSGPVIPDDIDLFGDRAKQDDWRGASEADHAPSDQAFFAPPKAHVEAIPDNWDLGDLGVPLAQSRAPAP